MQIIFKTLLLLLLLFNISFASEFNVQEVKKYIYKIEVIDTNNIKSRGSAVAINSDGKLVTAYHGIDSVKSIKAIDYMGKDYNVTLGNISVENDLAYIHIDTKNIPFAPIAKNNIAWSNDIYILNADNLLLKGMVSKIEPNGIIINLSITKGTSGGGVFNEQNELVAIALRMDIVDKTSYAVKYNYI